MDTIHRKTPQKPMPVGNNKWTCDTLYCAACADAPDRSGPDIRHFRHNAKCPTNRNIRRLQMIFCAKRKKF